MEESLAGQFFGYIALGDTWDGPLFDPNVPIVEGLLAGHVGELLPRAVIKLPADADLHSNWAVSEAWIVQLKSVYTAWSWDLTAKRTVYAPSADPDGLVGGLVTIVGKQIFVGVGDTIPAGVMVWSADSGLRPLIRWYHDGSRAAGNFGTDGKDMVWTYLEGTVKEIRTGVYATDAVQLAATTRRLRSDLGGLSPNPWTVGCGHAARAIGHDLFLVRLVDGASWVFPHLPWQSGSDTILWDAALGITCEELFAVAEVRNATVNTSRIVRMRLDSLGPGSPPD